MHSRPLCKNRCVPVQVPARAGRPINADRDFTKARRPDLPAGHAMYGKSGSRSISSSSHEPGMEVGRQGGCGGIVEDQCRRELEVHSGLHKIRGR